MAKIRAGVLALAGELAYIFEAIRLAQDRSEGNSEHKPVLLLLASSLDSRRGSLAKLSINGIKFSWLNHQDSAVVHTLRIGDLHFVRVCVLPSVIFLSLTFLRKHDVFMISSRIVLAPVGGIPIYEKFKVDLYPLRLQPATKVRQRIVVHLASKETPL